MAATVKEKSSLLEAKSSFTRQLAKYSPFYVMLAFPILYLLLFNYYPMYGVIIAFKNYNMGKGILGSEWNNLAHFRNLFADPLFGRALRNTVLINFYRIVFGFPAPILLALLINEVALLRFKKVVQTISYLPYFLSWIVLAALFIEFLSPERGPLNYLLTLIGLKPIYFLASRQWFRSVLVATGIWQGAGWSSVIYLASISTVDPQLYEAAEIDGAARLQKALRITLPSIMPVISLLFILQMGSLLSSSFDQVFNLLNPIVYEVGDVIDTYVYRRGILDAQYDYSAAVGLFVNVISVSAILVTNTVVKRMSEYALW